MTLAMRTIFFLRVTCVKMTFHYHPTFLATSYIYCFRVSRYNSEYFFIPRRDWEKLKENYSHIRAICLNYRNYTYVS